MNEIVLKNPITAHIAKSINSSTNKLNFAVPFLNSFAASILNAENTKNVADKRIVTRFDETCLISFDLPALKALLDLGFSIVHDNNIHLKLYITDNETFVTSSNLTQGGFEKNVELTIKVDSQNADECSIVFNEIWENAKENKVTYELLAENWPKYLILRKRDQYASNKSRTNTQVSTLNAEIEIEDIIKEIFGLPRDNKKIEAKAFKANDARKKFKAKLKNGFKKELFYAPPNDPERRNNLFYEFSYGVEESIASTGLRERQFKKVFEHDELKNVIEYIFPEMVGMPPWNFENDIELKEFCHGLFDYSIPQYSEALPIRLASYFYPDYFLPIFNLEHLRQMCESFGIATNAKTKGEKLYLYTLHITEKMKPLPYDNNIKSNIAYHAMYTVELYNRLKHESFEDIRSSYRQIWKKEYIDSGLSILKRLKYVS